MRAEKTVVNDILSVIENNVSMRVFEAGIRLKQTILEAKELLPECRLDKALN